MQVFAIVVSLSITLVAIALFARAIASIIGVIKTGQPVVGRRDFKGQRWLTMT